MSIKEDFPRVYKIVATLRAPLEATEEDVRTVLKYRLSELDIQNVELVDNDETN